MSLFYFQDSNAQTSLTFANKDSSGSYIYDSGYFTSDSTPVVNLQEVNIVSFKTAEEWSQYYKYKSRILKVLPYIKIAKQLYSEMKEEKQDMKHRQYRHYKRDLEKEMRGKFENELKDLTIGQGEMLFKLLNRETGNNSFVIIKELKGPLNAWFYQIVAKHWGYNLKDKYDPQKEKMIELIIRELGVAYNV
ncbi:MAG: DUF4294 domain-containing protein [Bacteroidetes bacterium]|nr:DUF4294 domain-containing protein [Bacteroidota bacterium]